MAYGRWTRWGRGNIGDMLRGQAVRGADGLYAASLNTMDLGRHATKEEAQQVVETRIELTMGKIFEDWAVYQKAGQRPTRRE